MCSNTWLDAILTWDCVLSVMSIILNVVLMLLVLQIPIKMIGSYKYLMMCYAALNVLYACCNVVVKPVINVIGNSFVIFTLNRLSSLNKFVGEIGLAIHGSLMASMLALLAIQFFYRYTVVFYPKLLFSRFSLKSSILWIAFIIAFSAIWGCSTYFLYDHSNEQELATEFNVTHCLGHANIGMSYFATSQTGKYQPRWLSILGVSIQMIQILSILGWILFAIYRTNAVMINNSRVIAVIKEQKEYYGTLKIQTVAQFFLIVIPMFCLFLLPLIGVRIGFAEYIIPFLYALIPLVSPLVALLNIKSLRSRLAEYLFNCGKERRSGQVYGVTYSEDFEMRPPSVPTIA